VDETLRLAAGLDPFQQILIDGASSSQVPGADRRLASSDHARRAEELADAGLDYRCR